MERDPICGMDVDPERGPGVYFRCELFREGNK
jgi:YHS domain-containing protein